MENRINPDGQYRAKQVAKLESICLATVYLRLARGEYVAYKDGRSTLIPGSSILAKKRFFCSFFETLRKNLQTIVPFRLR